MNWNERENWNGNPRGGGGGGEHFHFHLAWREGVSSVNDEKSVFSKKERVIMLTRIYKSGKSQICFCFYLLFSKD